MIEASVLFVYCQVGTINQYYRNSGKFLKKKKKKKQPLLCAMGSLHVRDINHAELTSIWRKHSYFVQGITFV